MRMLRSVARLPIVSGVPAVIGDADVPADAKTHQVSIEVAGRHARQRFFDEAIASVKADRVAVAHTRTIRPRP